MSEINSLRSNVGNDVYADDLPENPLLAGLDEGQIAALAGKLGVEPGQLQAMTPEELLAAIVNLFAQMQGAQNGGNPSRSGDATSPGLSPEQQQAAAADPQAFVEQLIEQVLGDVGVDPIATDVDKAIDDYREGFSDEDLQSYFGGPPMNVSNQSPDGSLINLQTTNTDTTVTSGPGNQNAVVQENTFG